MSYRDQVEELASELLGSQDEVASMASDLWCIEEQRMRQAFFDAVSGDCSALIAIMQDRAVVEAERRIADAEEEAADHYYEMWKARKRGELE